MVTGASEGLGARAMAADFGLEASPHSVVDASAAIGIAQRKGLGKIRHLDTQSLWIQDALRERRVEWSKVLGTEHPADMMIQPLGSKSLNKLMGNVGLEVRAGRAAIAPQLNEDAGVPEGGGGGGE